MIQILGIAIFLLGVVTIAIYPFDNRSINIHFITDNGIVEQICNSREIADGECRVFELALLDKAESMTIEKMNIYGWDKTILLKEIGYGEIYSNIEYLEQGEIQWGEQELILLGKGRIRLHMTDSFVEMIKGLSGSRFYERMIFEGLFICLIIFVIFLIAIIKERNTEQNWNNHGPIFEIRKFIEDVKKYRQYMVYAARTDLKAEVANSYLNRLWWLLEPFFNMIVYVIVFGNVMGNSVENYATFIFSALLMWNFFSKTVNYSVKLVRNNKDIITKVYIPKFIILLSNMILNFFKLLFSLLVLIAMLIIFRIQIGIQLLWLFPAYIVMMLLAFGVGMIFLHFGVYIDDLSYAVSILLNMLMFLSGIFYNTITTLPEPLNAVMMCLNPVAVVIDTMRNALLNNRAANIPILGVWFLISIILCGIGVHTVYKNENSYVKIV